MPFQWRASVGSAEVEKVSHAIALVTFHVSTRNLPYVVLYI